MKRTPEPDLMNDPAQLWHTPMLILVSLMKHSAMRRLEYSMIKNLVTSWIWAVVQLT